MPIDEEITQGLDQGVARDEPADGIRVLGVFVDIEYRDHVHIFGTGVIGSDEEDEV